MFEGFSVNVTYLSYKGFIQRDYYTSSRYSSAFTMLKYWKAPEIRSQPLRNPSRWECLAPY